MLIMHRCQFLVLIFQLFKILKQRTLASQFKSWFCPCAQMALLEEFQTLTSTMRFNLFLDWLNYPNSFISLTVATPPFPNTALESQMCYIEKMIQIGSSPAIGLKVKTRQIGLGLQNFVLYIYIYIYIYIVCLFVVS